MIFALLMPAFVMCAFQNGLHARLRRYAIRTHSAQLRINSHSKCIAARHSLLSLGGMLGGLFVLLFVDFCTSRLRTQFHLFSGLSSTATQRRIPLGLFQSGQNDMQPIQMRVHNFISLLAWHVRCTRCLQVTKSWIDPLCAQKNARTLLLYE